jgi:hypothetical protein
MIWHGSQQQMVFDNSLDKSVAVDSPKGNDHDDGECTVQYINIVYICKENVIFG